MFGRLYALVRAFGRDRLGLAPVEFALLMPALLVATLGIVDFSRAMFVNTTLKHAAVDAARFASIRGSEAASPVSETDVVDYAKARATGVPVGDITVTVTWSPNNNAGSTITVQLTSPFALMSIGFLPIVTPMQLSGTSTLVVL